MLRTFSIAGGAKVNGHDRHRCPFVIWIVCIVMKMLLLGVEKGVQTLSCFFATARRHTVV